MPVKNILPIEHNSLPQGVVREKMEMDVVIVGGGSAGLSCALQLAKKQKELTGQMSLNIAVLEKSSEVGNHSLSGAVINLSALKELLPNFSELGCPIESYVKDEEVHILTSESSIKLPVIPPPFENHGNAIISISKFNKWLASICEQEGVNIFSGFAAVEVLYDVDKVVGVRTGDKGRDKNGNPKSNFEPGILIESKVVVFAEGTRGSLFRQHAQKFNLRDGKNEEVFEEGVKEIIQMPQGTVQPGKVIHTMGFPLKKSIGGTFVYTLPNDRIVLGLVAYLDSADPLLDPHRELQKLKTHPFFRDLLKDGQVIAYGGKTLPAGGWYSIPKLFGDGWVVCGDTASLVDVQRLKGVHLSMKSGMLAAESILNALAKNFKVCAQDDLKTYEEFLENSFIKAELYRVRNFHQTLSMGFLKSLPLIGLQEITGGRGLFDNMKAHRDAETTDTVLETWGPEGEQAHENQLPKPDGKLFFDKLGSVYLTGTSHDEDSLNHLQLQNGDICRTECEPKYKSPCTHFCPAQVYEMIDSGNGTNSKDLKINYTNCIHCKTCDIKCPFDNILWTAPEGGGGPKYTEV
jgi:electron-transferring-flavoprotein dehydrogenase